MRELALRSGLSENGIYLIETGRRDPSSTSLENLARGLDVNPGVIFQSPLAVAR